MFNSYVSLPEGNICNKKISNWYSWHRIELICHVLLASSFWATACSCIGLRMPWKLLLPGSCDKVIKHARDFGVLQLAKNMGWISCRMLLEPQDLFAFNSSDIAAQVIRKKLQIARENPDFWCWKASRSFICESLGTDFIDLHLRHSRARAVQLWTLAKLGRTWVFRAGRAGMLTDHLWPLLRPSSEIIFCSWLEALSIALVLSPLLVWGYSWLLGSLKATNASSLGYYPQQMMCMYIWYYDMWCTIYDIWYIYIYATRYTIYDAWC